MPSTRRDFLNQTALAAAGLWFLPQVHGGTAMAQEQSTKPRGLIFDAADLPRLRETVKLPRFAPFWDSMRNADLAADRQFLEKELKLNNHVKDILRARQILERSSFVYALTGDKAHADIAMLAIRRILEYKRWDYFLEGGEETIGLQRAPETTIAMACACDWLEGVLDAGTRAEMEKQIAEKGAPACYRTLYGMKYPDRVKGWSFDPESDYKFRFDLSRWPFILNATNLKVIPIAGLGLAACLLRGKHPKADQWLDMAIQSARAYGSMFGTDGCYDEGAGYWGYTTLHLALLVETVMRRTGQDEGHIINFPGTCRYELQMSMPTTGRPDDCVNFSDAWRLGDVSVAVWSARRFHDSVAQYVAQSIGEIHNHFAIVWYDPKVQAQTPAPELQDVRFNNDWVVMRSGWAEADGVVAMRSGGPANHEHADRNSVLFKAYGERLFHDPYKAAYSYTEPLWLLRKTEAHTAVLIDGKGHQYHDGHEGTNASYAWANVLRFESAGPWAAVSSDAREAYRLVRPDVEEVLRTLVYLKPDILIVLDRIRLKTPAPVQIRFQVDNSDAKGAVKADGLGFTIARPGASLQAKVFSPGKPEVRTGALALPAELGAYPFAEVVSPAATEHLLITVCTAAPAGAPHGTLEASRSGNVWTIRGNHRNTPVDIVLNTADAIPGTLVKGFKK